MINITDYVALKVLNEPQCLYYGNIPLRNSNIIKDVDEDLQSMIRHTNVHEMTI